MYQFQVYGYSDIYVHCQRKFKQIYFCRFVERFLLNVVYSAQNEPLFEYDTQLGAQAATLLDFIGN